MTRRLLLLVALLASVAQAQVGMFSMPEYPVFLLRYPALQKELGLTGAPLAKVKKIQLDAQKRFLSMVSPAPGTMTTRQPSRTQVLEQAKKTDAQVLAVLTVKQKARLKEIGYQYAGGFALPDAKVAKAVGLSDVQRAKIQREGLMAIQQFNGATAALMPRVRDPKKAPDPKTQMEKMVQARVSMMNTFASHVAKLLDAKQLAKWKQMQGKPFPIVSLYSPIVPVR